MAATAESHQLEDVTNDRHGGENSYDGADYDHDGEDDNFNYSYDDEDDYYNSGYSYDDEDENFDDSYDYDGEDDSNDYNYVNDNDDDGGDGDDSGGVLARRTLRYLENINPTNDATNAIAEDHDRLHPTRRRGAQLRRSREHGFVSVYDGAYTHLETESPNPRAKINHRKRRFPGTPPPTEEVEPGPSTGRISLHRSMSSPQLSSCTVARTLHVAASPYASWTPPAQSTSGHRIALVALSL
ncbi:hypothetical protein BGW41_003507 [Actinomortierella wolfii]|nr:hypothetical protein BGW41_003507 [Actinomortierella wolfii]